MTKDPITASLKPALSDSASDTDGSQSLETPLGKPASRNTICWVVGVAMVVATVVAVPAIFITQQKDEEKTTASAKFNSFEYKPEDTAQCPGHLSEGGDFSEVSQVYFSDLVLGERDKAGDRTFDVEPSHAVLASGGVEFNVETVEEALQDDQNKAILTEEEIMEQMKTEAGQFYVNMTGQTFAPPLPNVSLEVASTIEDPLVFAGSQGFLAACMMSFAQHLPLALSADDLWTVISQGFAYHLNEHAEELRHNFVEHEGKKEIRVREDKMERGQSPANTWEELIFPQFSEAIELNMNNDEVYETLAGTFFTTTTPASQAASEIVLMAAVKSYFQYTVVTACGIPKIRLDGTREDWVALRDRAEKLAKWMMSGHSHGDLWVQDIVIPILNEFIDAYDGKINYCFWQTMIKFRTTGKGSGTFDFLSGWLPTLFPYLSQKGTIKPNPFLRSWEESASDLHQGPEPSDIPGQLSSVSVMWEYHQLEFPIHFHAGFRGVTQEADGTLSPVLGWFVTNDPDKEPSE